MRKRRQSSRNVVWTLLFKVLVNCIFLVSILPTSTTEASQSVVVLTDDSFDHFVRGSRDPWFVQFYSPDSVFCKKLVPTWEALANEFPQHGVHVAAIDVTSNPQTQQRFGTATYPTLIYFHKSKMYMYEGDYMSTEGYREFLSHMKDCPNQQQTAAHEVPPPIETWKRIQWNRLWKATFKNKYLKVFIVLALAFHALILLGIFMKLLPMILSETDDKIKDD